MCMILADEYPISFESYGSKSYLSLEVKNRDRIIGYQVEMLRYNPGHGRASVDSVEKDGRYFLYYDITSLLPLKYFIERRQFTKRMFIDVLVKIADAVSDTGGYLLKNDGFMLEKQFIFLDSSTGDVSLIYLPVNKLPAGNTLKSLAAELLADVCDIDDGNKDGFADRVLSSISSDTFSLKEFVRILNGMAQGHDKQESSLEHGELIPLANFNEDMAEQKNERKKPRLRWEIAIMVLLQAVIILLVILAPKLLSGISGDVKANYVAVALIAGALDLLALKYLLKYKPAVISPNGCTHEEKEIELQEPEEKAQTLAGKKDYIERTTEANNANANIQDSGTMILKAEFFDHPVLICTADGAGEEILIAKNDFVIGRLAGQVDYVSRNPAMGKLHARILCREGNYYLTDLNSRNGTFVNGTRLNGCLEQQIKNGDRVTFANRDYTFLWR